MSNNNPQQYSHEHYIAWMRLARASKLGAKSFHNLLELFPNPQDALEYVKEINAKHKISGKKQIQPASIAEIEKEIELTEAFGAEILPYYHECYPKLLKQICDAPPVIIVKGDSSLLSKKSISIVGARNASIQGKSIAKKISNDLGEAGYIVVSGLARGIDTVAHQAAINHGTIGVIAGGIDSIYPKENRSLYEQMYEKHLIITEYPIRKPPIAQYFPQRNRIIAGLSIGTMVIEAAIKSGTLITTRLALEYNREVFAIPGSPLDSRYHGTNALIKNGAYLVESAEDIINIAEPLIEQLAKIDAHKKSGSAESAESTYYCSDGDSKPYEGGTQMSNIHPKHYEIILDHLSYSPINVTQLIESINDIPTRVIHLALIELEIEGKIHRDRANNVCLQPE